jgi:hypothetical protein
VEPPKKEKRPEKQKGRAKQKGIRKTNNNCWKFISGISTILALLYDALNTARPPHSRERSDPK